MYKGNSYFLLLAGLLLVTMGLDNLLTETTWVHRGVPVVSWVGWIFLFVGSITAVLSIVSLCHESKKSKAHIQEELDKAAAKAEAELDAMYFRDHGKLPDKSEKLKESTTSE